MSPKLKGLDVDGMAARLDAAGDAPAAAALRSLRDAVAAQDEALRDLVADAQEVREEREEDGSYVVIHSRLNGFEDLASAFGYPAVEGFDREAFDRASARDGGAEPYDGHAYLSGLEHLQAKIATDICAPEELLAQGYVAIAIGHGPRQQTLYHWDERHSPGLAESRAAEAPVEPAP